MYLSLIERNPNNLGSESWWGFKDAARSSQVDSGWLEVGVGLEESSRIQTLMDMSRSFRLCAGTRDRVGPNCKEGLELKPFIKSGPSKWSPVS